jgi:hypothetical protein
MNMENELKPASILFDHAPVRWFYLPTSWAEATMAYHD